MMELLQFIPWSDALKGNEREWLEANGFHNTYKDGYPPIDGMYEWGDINKMKIYLFKAGPNGVFITDGDCWNPSWWRATEKTKKMLLRSPCDRYCDCEWCSMMCFIKRGYIWDKTAHSFVYGEDGKAMRTKKRACDWNPEGQEHPIMPGGFGAGEGYVGSQGNHWRVKEAADDKGV